MNIVTLLISLMFFVYMAAIACLFIQVRFFKVVPDTGCRL